AFRYADAVPPADGNGTFATFTPSRSLTCNSEDFRDTTKSIKVLVYASGAGAPLSVVRESAANTYIVEGSYALDPWGRKFIEFGPTRPNGMPLPAEKLGQCIDTTNPTAFGPIHPHAPAQYY